VEEDPRDANYQALKENYQLLKSFSCDAAGFRIVPIPMPDPIEADWGRLPASYANFYIANSVVLVPNFGCQKDALVLDRLQPLFPGRKVTPIQCEPMIWGMGAIHCLTQQEPAL
jgi:agmatine deiminase